MVSWQVRGVVPDSDDEDGNLSQTSSISNAADVHEAQDEQHEERPDENGGSTEQFEPARSSPPHQTESSDEQLLNTSAPQSPCLKPDRKTAAPSQNGHGQQADMEASMAQDNDFDELQNDPIYHASSKTTSNQLHSSQNSSTKVYSFGKQQNEKDIFDIPSSPLSVLDDISQIEEPESNRASPLHREQPEVLPVSQRRPQLSEQEAHIPSSFISHEHRSRTFRQRHPIQLHPYLLEDVHYRHSLRTRGLRPVAISAEEARRTESLNQESQFGQTSDRLSDQQIGPDSSQDSYKTASSDLQGNHESFHVNNPSGDDFPHIDSIARPPIASEVRQRIKRRKITHAKPQRSLSVDGSLSRNRTPESQVEQGKRSLNQRPKSGQSLSASTTRPRFQFPEGFKPAQLPTPLPSSETKTGPLPSIKPRRVSRSPRTQAELIDMSSPSPLRISSRSPHHDGDSASSAASSSDDDIPDVEHSVRQKMGRKIRGVLPASWLRFDIQNRAQESPNIQPPRRPSTSQGSGVPRVTESIKHRRHSENTNPTIVPVLEISSEGEHESPKDSTRHTSSIRKAARPSAPTATEMNNGFEVLEDDRIDRMIPRKRRANAEHTGNRKKQLRMTDHFSAAHSKMVRSTRSSSKAKDRSMSDRPPKGRTSTRTSRMKKFAQSVIPRMSVLDAPKETSSASTPHFIKVAKRKARARNDGGRHPPSGKSISLQTRQDGEEIDHALHDWRQGRTPHKAKADQIPNAAQSPARSPLKELSHNSLSSSRSSRGSELSKEAGNQHDEQHDWQELGSNTSMSKRNRLEVIHPSSSKTSKSSQPNFKTRQKPVPSRGRLKPSSLPKPERQGQLEESQAELDRQYPDLALHRGLQDLDRANSGDHLIWGDKNQTSAMSNFLGHETAQSNAKKRSRTTSQIHQPIKHHSPARSMKSRKRRPHFIDLDQVEIHQPATDTVPFETLLSSSNELLSTQHRLFEGLGPFGTHYTTDFGITPLPVGVCFRQDTFIGSGDLHSALNLHSRDLDSETVGYSIRLSSGLVHMGPWTEEVAAHLDQAFNEIASTFEHHTSAPGVHVEPRATKIPRDVINYFSKALTFLDPVDREPFVSSTANSIERTTNIIRDTYEDHRSSRKPDKYLEELVLKHGMWFLVLLGQLTQISEHNLIQGPLKARVGGLYTRIAKSVVKSIMELGRPELKEFHDLANIIYARECGIRPSQIVIEVLVTTSQVIRFIDCPQVNFWVEVRANVERHLLPVRHDIKPLEDFWHTVFAVVPLLEFDIYGTLRPRSRFKLSSDDKERWNVVKDLLNPVLDSYADDSNPSRLNDYIRAILTRCYRLLRTWGWRKCESVLARIFDFFAHRSLSMLQNEEQTGSSSFLEGLDKEPRPMIVSCDRSFQIFLKFLAVAIIDMQKFYSEKKIKNVAYRCVPGHGRTHKKEESLRKHDLESLRNHHDLLCVLYYASPVGVRFKVDPIRNLVPLKLSHSEVCHLTVRAWSNLLRFVVSTEQDASTVRPFVDWMNDILEQTLSQYAEARPAAEDLFHRSSMSYGHEISRESLEPTISQTRRQLEGILSSALTGLGNLICCSKNFASAVALFRGVNLRRVCQEVEPKSRGSTNMIVQVFRTFEQFFDVVEKQRLQLQESQSSNESQDYGEFPISSDEEEKGIPPETPTELVAADQIQQFLAIYFGRDKTYQEIIYVKLVDAWVRSACVIVRKNIRDWSYYLEPQCRGYWRQEENDITKKFAPYCFACLLETESQCLDEYSPTFFRCLMTSLVERESMLKYQHKLLAVMLSAWPDHPLLLNLPFAWTPGQDRPEISIDELRSRRLGLISSLLANIRALWDRLYLPSESYQGTRQNVPSMLKDMMNTMKRTYQHTQLDPSMRGAYVEFVQNVIQLFQEYVADICPVDRFFTDPSFFPLPTSDPMYVIGRLKGYVTRLKRHDESGNGNFAIIKRLAFFLQNLCHRAALEGQQSYLKLQLALSVEGTEVLLPGQDSLRMLFLNYICPAYVEAALEDTAGYLVIAPVLELIPAFIEGLWPLCELDNENLEAILRTMKPIMEHCWVYVQLAFAHEPERDPPFHFPTKTLAMAVIIDIVRSILPFVDYYQRKTPSQDDESVTSVLLDPIRYFARVVHVCYTNAPWLAEDFHVYLSVIAGIGDFAPRRLEDGTRDISDDVSHGCICVELLDMLDQWHWREPHSPMSERAAYVGPRSDGSKGSTIAPSDGIGDIVEASGKLKDAMKRFLETMDQMPWFKDIVHAEAESEGGGDDGGHFNDLDTAGLDVYI
ncbi:MAG: hypothetical protein M1831_001438 [Alyxoria varia]|nr:MAG: hypothetical protein M1831_001438 [Alyxoria varia]